MGRYTPLIAEPISLKVIFSLAGRLSGCLYALRVIVPNIMVAKGDF